MKEVSENSRPSSMLVGSSHSNFNTFSEGYAFYAEQQQSQSKLSADFSNYFANSSPNQYQQLLPLFGMESPAINTSSALSCNNDLLNQRIYPTKQSSSLSFPQKPSMTQQQQLQSPSQGVITPQNNNNLCKNMSENLPAELIVSHFTTSSKKAIGLPLKRKSSQMQSSTSKNYSERLIPSRKNTKMQINFQNKEKNRPSMTSSDSSSAASSSTSLAQDSESSSCMSIASLYQKHVLATCDTSKILSFQNTSQGQTPKCQTLFSAQPSSMIIESMNEDFSYQFDENSYHQFGGASSGYSTPSSYPGSSKSKSIVYADSTKILDAPGLEDDYYLNLLHWSAQNVISIVLKNEVFGYNCNTKKIFSLQKPDQFNTYKFTSVKFSKSGKLLAIGDSLGGVQVIDVESRNEVAFFQNHEDRVASLAWIDDNILASGSKDSQIHCHDIRDTSIIRKYTGHKNEVCGLEWSQDQQSLASGGNDDKLFVWNIAYNQYQWKFTEHKAAVKAIAWSPHQHGLLASGGGSRDKTIRFWNIHSGKQVDFIETNSQVCSLGFTRNVNQFVSTHGFADNEIYVWRYPQKQKVKIFQGHQQRVIYMAMGPDQKSIVTGSSDETLRFWDAFPDAHEVKGPETSLKFSDLR